ncbi:uncharacterized protein LOC132733669 [Ruditapes philippinarum]|uniref:uncharacterized protein LOC132733669 n=1 Tax=Ruditapes philippinarum TaxID=129788 RepID=UPI00295AAFB8|nr:uncharacterized protein LOC132733669 [Ruditapes philippinarum]
MNIKIGIVFLQLLIPSYGYFELACDSANPSAQTDLTCVCRRTVGSGIKWFFNGNSISDCFLNSGCLPQPIGYTISINVSEFAYEMTKSAYDYNDCTQINCTDASNTRVQLMVVPGAINFDPSNLSPISEPTISHSNGNFSISTGCISGYTDVTCEWYTVYNEVQEKYTNGQFAFNENDSSGCSNCNDDVNARKTCGFYHIEASGNETKNVNFRVVLTHTPTNLKWEVNSSHVYTVKIQ